MEASSLHLSAVILAAGFSSRMGRMKALLPMNESTVLDLVIALFQDNDIQDIVVVTGQRSKEIVTSLKGSRVRTVHNPNYHRDMFSSVQSGIRSLDHRSQGVFLLPVDIPLVRPGTVGRMVGAFRSQPQLIVHPCFRGKLGHPPLIPAKMMPGILQWTGTHGLRGYLASQDSSAITMEVPDRFILEDMDTPEDYLRLGEECQGRDIPNRAECEVVLKEIFPVGSDVLSHSRQVAEIAIFLARTLLASGENLDLGMVYASALLHDIAKGNPSHAELGGQWLAELGFDRIGAIVAAHHDPGLGSEGRLDEKQIVYLADKLVLKDERVSLDHRFEAALERHGHHPQVRENILQRRAQATKIAQLFEQKTDMSLTTILSMVDEQDQESKVA